MRDGPALVRREIRGGVGLMRGGTGSYGFDASCNKYVDLVEAGMIEPTPIVRMALENAVSATSVLLLTEATVTEIPEVPERSRTHGLPEELDRPVFITWGVRPSGIIHDCVSIGEKISMRNDRTESRLKGTVEGGNCGQSHQLLVDSLAVASFRESPDCRRHNPNDNRPDTRCND